MHTPPSRLREPCQIGPLAIVALAATLFLVAAGRSSDLAREPAAAGSTRWIALVPHDRANVAIGQRTIVVLKAPSLADRVALVGGLASEEDQRRWTREALDAQRRLLERLSLQGARIEPDLRYTRVLNGFSAALDPRAVSLLDQAPEVEGLYPVRIGYPAGLSLRTRAHTDAGRSALSLPGFDGSGVTIALLDTGVDRLHPYLGNRVRKGFDIVSGDRSAGADANPADGAQLERHGTEMAGILVGEGGPDGVAGVARGATVLPIRVAGWQQEASGDWAVFARTDQVIAGLERAVDPNGDGDAHDGTRVTLLPLAEPFASFADGPEARAVGGAFRLDNLVVVPAGNDGPGGAAYGLIAGPGGAPAALTVGAADLRRRTEDVRLVLRSGLSIVYEGVLPLAGPPTRTGLLTLPLGAPRLAEGGSSLDSYFDAGGRSLVAGRAALVPAGENPTAGVESAAAAGAHAVLLYGESLPAGALGLDQSVGVPVIGLPSSAATAIRAAIRAGTETSATIGAAQLGSNSTAGHIATFSSRGPSFDGRVKPDIAAPGVALRTAEPGVSDDGLPRYGTVNGSSVAAATVAGAAALLAQARPGIDARSLRSLLSGSARPLAGDSIRAQGTGLVDVGAAVASELAVEPGSLAFPLVTKPDWGSSRELTVRNLSTRPLRAKVRFDRRGQDAQRVSFSAFPSTLALRPGDEARVRVRAQLRGAAQGPPLEGVVRIIPEAGVVARVPWALTFGPSPANLIGNIELRPQSFRPSDTRPAVLSLRAGVIRPPREVHALARLDIELWSRKGRRFGPLARLRNVLPGRLGFGLTGRGPGGQVLGRGWYRLRLTAVPTGDGPPTRRTIDFRLLAPRKTRPGR